MIQNKKRKEKLKNMTMNRRMIKMKKEKKNLKT